jgi:ATP-dependent Clp protease adaptor protein ClpS
MVNMHGVQQHQPMQPNEQTPALAEPDVLLTEPPPFYQVVMLNDDFTPMEFVVYVIQEYFGKDLEVATTIMLKIHYEGRGICGVFPRDIAATKVDMVLSAAQQAQHPLQCIMEAV